jgi:hypothetical protein
MRHISLLIGLIAAFGTQAGVTADRQIQSSTIERLEPVVTVEFVDLVARHCTVNTTDSPDSRRGDVLYGILLAARESGLEVESIETDSCSAGYSGF